MRLFVLVFLFSSLCATDCCAAGKPVATSSSATQLIPASPRIVETDSSLFKLAAPDDQDQKKSPSEDKRYCFSVIFFNVFLMFNRDGEIDKRSKAPGLVRRAISEVSAAMIETAEDSYFVNSKKEKATEALIMVRNLNEDRSMFLQVTFNENDYGTAGIPPEYKKPIGLLKPHEQKHGDWPFEKFLTVKIRVDDLKKGTYLVELSVGRFRKKGDEAGQYTSKWDSNEFPEYTTYRFNLIIS